MKPIISDLESMARQAGGILRAGFGSQLRVDHKGIIDLVTEMDHRSEKFLLGEIQRRFPTHKIVSEESGEIYGEDCCLWFIDPLDGTVNYAHGLPIFTVSIAYQEDDALQLGVVYEPMLDECYTAIKGQGAWLNGKLIQASTTSELNRSLLVTGFPYDIRTNPENNLENYVRLSLRTQGVRRLGSAALDLCYVAAGRFDGFWEIRLSAWDVAAGGLIAKEAGAVVTNLTGGQDFLSPPQSIIAANPDLHPQLVRALNE
ncbi:MAG: inositol monophosphatase family protein [Anaerolineales bacterium]|jgi:myo-inositol-1(or 4)-monophosphatase